MGFFILAQHLQFSHCLLRKLVYYLIWGNICWPKILWKAGFPIDYLGVKHPWRKTLPSSELLIQIIGEPCVQRQEHAPFELFWNLISTWNSSIQLRLQKKKVKLCVKIILGNGCSWHTSVPALGAPLSKWVFSFAALVKECVQTKRSSKQPCITPVCFHLRT